MVHSRGGGLNPLQPTGGDDFIPRDRHLRMAAINISRGELLGDALLARVDNLTTGPDGKNLGKMALFDGITEKNSHGNRVENDELKDVARRISALEHSAAST